MPLKKEIITTEHTDLVELNSDFQNKLLLLGGLSLPCAVSVNSFVFMLIMLHRQVLENDIYSEMCVHR